MSDELAERRRHLEALLRRLNEGECECKALSWHLWSDEHPARWCERHPCPHRDGPPTPHARLAGCWSRSGP